MGERVAVTLPPREVRTASAFHWPPYGRESRVTRGIPRATPDSCIVVPYSSGAAGGVRVIAPIVNQVERRPIAARAAEPLIVRVPFVPINVSVRTRPSGAAAQCSRVGTANDGAIALAALFTRDAKFENASLFSEAPLFIYAMNDAARATDGVVLVDIGGVTSCASDKKNII